jgi:flavin reductase (DIM6/NTAB) family NADH-FMN oxidoreductase RutF
MKAVYNISYGLYILTAKGDKMNGCVINTLNQVTTTPNRIVIAVNKQNYTTELIRKTKKFNVSILDEKTEFDLISHFGFQSGKDVDKFENFSDFKLADNDIAYITKNTNAYITASVVEEKDLGTHIMFFADVDGDFVLSSVPSLTYAYYLQNIKPTPKTDSKKVVHVCKICGYVYEGDTLPEDFVCPLCKHGAVDFEKREN